MKKIIDKKENDLFTKCDCNCGQQLLINVFDKDSVEINTRIDGRKKWTGVVLNKEDVKRLQDFFNSFF